MNQSNVRDTHWILLRGLARESRHWGKFPHALEEKMTQLTGGRTRVDTLDLPGAGRYSEMRSPLSVPEMTEFCRGKFLEIRARQRETGEVIAKNTFLVAVSLGGMVASNWLERSPEDFAGCVLINTSFRSFSPIYHRLSPKGFKHLFEVVKNRDPLQRERAVLKLISNRSEIHDEVAEEWAKLALERPVSAENIARQLIAAALFESKIKTPPVPTLILSSVNDRMVSPNCSEVIAKKWACEIQRHPSAGHDLTTDDSPWAVEKITGWWTRKFAPIDLRQTILS